MGKTTLVNDFAKTYTHKILLNLEKPSDRSYFTDFDNVKSIVEALLLAYRIPSTNLMDTLLFIDEIQAQPQAIHLLRYFMKNFQRFM